MEGCSCLPRSRRRGEPMERHRDEINLYKDSTRMDVMGYSKEPTMQTLIEVLKCRVQRPGRSLTGVADNELGPTKQWTPLYYAVYHNREAALSHFLRAGHSPDGVASIGQPPLCIAVAAGHIEIVKTLCQVGANVKAAMGHNGETALHIAVKTGRNDIVDILLLYGPDLDARTQNAGETPLHYAAARSGSLATIVTLLKCGADYEVLNSKGSSPADTALGLRNVHGAVAIISAAREKRGKLVKEKEMLLKHIEKVENRFSMNNELIADIFEASCPPDSTVLVEAIKRDDVNLVDMFLNKGADPNRTTSSGGYPIFIALNCSRAQVVHALVKHGADVTLRDPCGLTVLQAALDGPSAHDKEAMSGIFEALLSNGADPQVGYPDGTTLLHHTVMPSYGLARVAHQLLQRGVPVNAQDLLGNTALHFATHSRSCIGVLLKHGADVHLANNEGQTPLLYATSSAVKEQEPDLEQLIKASKIHATDSTAKTALHLAAENGYKKTVNLLLQARANPASFDSQKRTPLMLAALNHQWNIVPILATKPGNNSWDEDGRTALHHIATSSPKSPSTWADITSAIAPFCERGYSRSLRDRLGATSLINAIQILPEEGLPTLEILLSQNGPGRSNCVGHEDHRGKDALYYAATLGKPVFVEALLKNGAPLILNDWKPTKGPIKPDDEVNKQILKLIAKYDWLQRLANFQPQTNPTTEDLTLPTILPVRDLRTLLSMGLDPNALPSPKFPAPLVWGILNQAFPSSPLPPQYLLDVFRRIFSHGADPNATIIRSRKRTSQPRNSQKVGSAVHPLAFLLEQSPSIDIDIITLFLQSGAKLSIASPFYDGRHPLHSAVQANRIDVVDEFLMHKADANCVDSKERTPLFIAAERGFWEIADLLLRSNATINIKDGEGNTPLHAAACGGNKKIVSRLLRAGAKASETNNAGLLPSKCVSKKEEEERIIAILKNSETQERQDAANKAEQLRLQAIKKEKEEAERKEREQKQKIQSTAAPTSTTLTPPRNTTITKPLNLLTRLASDAQKRSSAPIGISKQLMSIRYTPPSPRREQSNADTQPTQNLNKALPQPKDSSGAQPQQKIDVKKPVPPTPKVEEEELADWLALSKMLDRL